MPNLSRCRCSVVGCNCRRETVIVGQGKCSLCFSGQHSDAFGHPLCRDMVCRRLSVLATDRARFDVHGQPLCCPKCTREWKAKGVPTERLTCCVCGRPSGLVMLDDGSLTHTTCNEDAKASGATA